MNRDAVSSQAQDFIRRLLVFDPAQRMSAAEALKHEWVHSIAVKVRFRFRLVCGHANGPHFSGACVFSLNNS